MPVTTRGAETGQPTPKAPVSGTPPRESRGLVVVSSDEDHTLGTYRNVAVVVWQRETRLDVLLRMRKVAAELATRHRRVGAVVVLGAEATIPEPAVRGELQAMCRDTFPAMACVAYVAEQVGFKGAVFRSLITGLMLVMAPRVNVKVFPTVQAATFWLGDHLGPIDGLADAVGHLSAPRPRPGLATAP